FVLVRPSLRHTRCEDALTQSPTAERGLRPALHGKRGRAGFVLVRPSLRHTRCEDALTQSPTAERGLRPALHGPRLYGALRSPTSDSPRETASLASTGRVLSDLLRLDS